VWRGVLLALMSALVTMPVQPASPPGAAQIQAATRARLGVLGDAFTCADARFASYRRSTAEPEIVDQWYVASQLWADALLLSTDEDTHCYVDKGFIFLDRLWDYTSAGYFPRSNPVGTQVENKTRFGDDNSLGGLALLAAATATNDPLTKQRYIHAAVREADFLLQSGLWDNTFGGGFWWNTGRGDSAEGKPAQTNALAALFFASLFDATDDANYRDWALRTLLWLDTILYDPGKHLYRWSVAYRDIPSRSGALISERLFNYDQGLAIQAQIAAYALDGDANRLARAADIGRAVMPVFWSNDLAGLNLEASVPQVFTSYSAWTSLGHLALYQLDHDPEWLAVAQQNASALTAAATDGAFPLRKYGCRDRSARGCESGQPMATDPTVDTAAQAWAQHLMGVLDVAS
jgi:Glycosyl hydrolase family 76